MSDDLTRHPLYRTPKKSMDELEVEQTEPENERVWEFDDGSRWELGNSMAGGAHADSRTINGQMVPGFITMRIVSANGKEQEHMYVLTAEPPAPDDELREALKKIAGSHYEHESIPDDLQAEIESCQCCANVRTNKYRIENHCDGSGTSRHYEQLAIWEREQRRRGGNFDVVLREIARTALIKGKTGDTLLERYRRALERISEHEVEEPAQIAHDALHPKKSTTLTGTLHLGSKLPHG